MLLRYILLAFRNLRRQRMFSFINITGLAISMMVCLTVLISAKRDLSYDRFHPAGARTWRITSRVQNPDGHRYHMASTPVPLGEALETAGNGIEKQVTLYSALNGEVLAGKKKLGINAAYTTPAFFDVFGFRLATGNPRTALAVPNSIVLTPGTAERFFGHNDPMGKVIHFPAAGDFIVTGVLAKQSDPSHIGYEAFASLSSVATLEENKVLPERLQNWDIFQDSYTYVVLQRGVKVAALQMVLDQIARRYETGPAAGRTHIVFDPQSLLSITPSTELYNDNGGGISLGKFLAQLAVAFAILLCACFNYTNLSIVRSLQRSREVGVRKVNGAQRWQIFTQFVIESVIMCLLALIAAFILLLLMKIYKPFGLDIIPDLPIDLSTICVFLVFSILTGIVAGIIPAWALSAFQPAKVLRNIVDIHLLGGLGLRKTLLVIQFSLSLTAVVFL